MKTHSQNIFCRQMLLFSNDPFWCPGSVSLQTGGGVLMTARYTLTSSQRGPGAELPVLRKPQKSIFTLQTIFVICFNSEAKRGFENQ